MRVMMMTMMIMTMRMQLGRDKIAGLPIYLPGATIAYCPLYTNHPHTTAGLLQQIYSYEY